MKNLNLETPSVSAVKNCLEKWRNSQDADSEKFRNQEKCVLTLFKQYPKNADLQEVLTKACVLNYFYSTNILDVHFVAQHIVGLNIDNALDNADVDIVDKIARVKIGGKDKRFYSFATKYCSHHRPDKFPIYDSLVSEALMYFKNKDKFSAFKYDDLRDYKIFVKVISAFSDFYKLNEFSLRELDLYLWSIGKESLFQKNNNKKLTIKN